MSEETLEDALQEQSDSDDVYPALVLDANGKAVKVYRRGGETIEISGDGLKFARAMIGEKAPNNRKLRRGALIRVQQHEKGSWQIVQIPKVEAALVPMDPNDGAIRALVGGFDFYRNKFNHAAQAYRQPGSSFKPFIYSAALERGFTAATIINDAPLVIDAAETGSVLGAEKLRRHIRRPIRLRTALTKSKNLVSIRIPSHTPQCAPGLHHPFRLRPAQHPPCDHGAGRQLRHPAGNSNRLLGVRQRRLQSGALFHYAGGRRQRAGAGQGRAGARQRGCLAHDRQPQRVRDVQRHARRDPRRHRCARHVSWSH